MKGAWFLRLRPGLLKKAGVTLSFPFEPGIPVFKVAGKMFAVFSASGDEEWLTLKCDPDLSVHLRAQYAWIQPGYHTNTRHWITLQLGPRRPLELVRRLLGSAYLLAAQGLSKVEQGRLGLALPARDRTEVVARQKV